MNPRRVTTAEGTLLPCVNPIQRRMFDPPINQRFICLRWRIGNATMSDISVARPCAHTPAAHPSRCDDNFQILPRYKQ